MGKRYLEKKKKVFVIASADCLYMKKSFGKSDYSFIDDIEGATKFISRELAKNYIEYYKHDLGQYALDVIVIPLEISYELIRENKNEYNEYLN